MNFITILSKALKWTELVGIVFTLVAIVFKMLNLSGAPQFLLVGLLTLLLLTFYLLL